MCILMVRYVRTEGQKALYGRQAVNYIERMRQMLLDSHEPKLQIHCTINAELIHPDIPYLRWAQKWYRIDSIFPFGVHWLQKSYCWFIFTSLCWRSAGLEQNWLVLMYFCPLSTSSIQNWLIYEFLPWWQAYAKCQRAAFAIWIVAFGLLLGRRVSESADILESDRRIIQSQTQ